jgi:WD40 repeat protein
MKTIFSTILLFLVLFFMARSFAQNTVGTGQYVDNENILTNPGFESGSSKGWIITTSGTVSLDTDIKFEGAKSLKIVLSSQPFLVMNVSAMLASPASEGLTTAITSARVRSTVPFKVCPVVAGAITDNCSSPVQRSGKWELHSVTSTMGAVSNGVAIQSIGSVTGTIWIDKVSVSPSLETAYLNNSPKNTIRSILANGKFNATMDFTAPVKITTPLSPPLGNGTSSAFSPDGRWLVVTESLTPFLDIYEKVGGIFVRQPNPAVLPTGAIGFRGVSFSSNSRYVSVSHANTPFLTVYEIVGNTFTKLTNPTSLPSSTLSNSISPDSRFVAVGATTTPFIHLYERSAGVLTKLPNPSVLPNAQVRSVSWSPDGKLLVVSVIDAVSLVVYSVSGNTFTNLPEPSIMPEDLATGGASFSPDGKLYAVAIFTDPFVNMYSVSGTTFTKIASPTVIPTAPQTIAFSSDGRYLTCVHINSPFITTFTVSSSGALTKIPDPVSLPVAGLGGVAFSVDNRFIAISHSNTPFMTIYETASPAQTDLGIPSSTIVK